MYLRARRQSEQEISQYDGRLSAPYLGQPKIACSYEKGEIAISRCQEGPCQNGHLPFDVRVHPRGLLVADFGVNWSGIKKSTKQEKTLEDWVQQVKSILPSISFRIYGYSDCMGEDRYNTNIRLKRAQRVYDELLDKDLKSRVAYVGAAPSTEFIAGNETKEGRAQNRGVIIEVVRSPKPKDETSNPPPPAPTPQPPRANPNQPTWKLVNKNTWKSPRRLLRKVGYFEFFGEVKVDATWSVNATDQEYATFAVKWENGKLKGGEVDTKFGSWFVPELKIERDKEKWTIALKKSWKVPGTPVTFKPHLQFSTELVKTEVIPIGSFEIEDKFFGKNVKIKVEPKVVVIIKIDLLQILVDRLRGTIKSFLSDLLSSLFSTLGAGLSGLAKLILAALLGGVLAKLLVSERPTKPVKAPPNDVAGKDAALKWAGNAPSAAHALQNAADTLRQEFAKAFAHTLLKLLRENWLDYFNNMHPIVIMGYPTSPPPPVGVWHSLPPRGASSSHWIKWASGPRGISPEEISIPVDAFVERFRLYELAVMFEVAAWIRKLNSKADLDQALNMAKEQVQTAGTAAAVQYVHNRLAEETFEFIDENNRLQEASGIERWNTTVKLTRSLGLKDDEIRERLEQLGAEQLPSLFI